MAQIPTKLTSTATANNELVSLVSNFTALSRRAVWTFATRLAMLSLVASLASLSTGLLFAGWIVSQEAVSAHAATTISLVLVACYLLAGLAWAAHRSYHTAVERTIPVLEEQVPTLLSRILDPVLANSAPDKRAISIDDARRTIANVLDGQFVPGAKLASRLPWGRSVIRWLTKRCLSAELDLASETLDSLEQDGQEHFSLTDLKDHLQPKMIAGLVALVRSHVRSVGLVGAVAVFLLIVAPVAAALLAVG